MRTRLSFRKEFGGRLCGSAGAYATSKHAVEAFTDSLTQQVAGASVQVSLVEPGN